MGGNQLTNVGAPIADTDAARLQDIGPSFYGIIVKDSDSSTVLKDDTIEFLAADFDVADVGNKPRVSLDATVAKLADIPPAFYGVNVKQSDDAASFTGINTVAFNTNDFYVTQNAPNTDEVVINLKGTADGGVTDHGALTGLGDDDHTQYILADGTRAFTGDQSMGGNQLTNVGAPAAGTDAARLQDIGPSFYGIVIKESDGSPTLKDDTIEFLTGDFVVSEVSDKPRVALDSSVARLTDIPPGFYGINVKQSDDVMSFKDINTVAFNTDDFYITQNDPNTDEVLVSFRGLPVGTGEANTASNLPGGDEGLFSTKSGVDLQFKSLIGGTNVTLSSDANTVTIDADVPPGFYGVTVKQTDDAASFKGINTLGFNADSFYITQNDPNTDEIIVNFRGSAGASDHGALTGLGDDDHTQYTLADGTRTFTGDQSMGSNRLTNVGAPTADTDAARLQDIGPGFYGIIVKESDGSPTLKDDTIEFLTGDFVVSEVASKPRVTLDSSVARLTDVGPGFYGINIKQSDDAAAFTGIGTVAFNTDDFYVTQNDPNTDEVVVNLRAGAIDHGTLTGLGDDDHTQYTLVDGTRAFTGDQSMGSNRLTNVGAPTADTDAARLQDIPPGFYGINVKQSDDAASFIGIGTVAFNTSDFYITQNDPNTDEVLVSFRGLPVGTGEANTASNLAGDEGLFAQKSGVDLQFKSLTAGTNVTLTSDANAVTITADTTPGFYGINVKQSDDAASFSGVNTVAFNTDDFYVTQNASNTDEVVVNFRGSITDHGALAGLGDDDHTQYTLADGTRAFTGDQSMGSNRLTNVGAPTADTDAARLQDIPPGFYGINVKQSDDAASFTGIGTVAFNTDDFYVTQNDPNTDEVIVNLRTGAVDHGTLTGLADDDHTQYTLADGTRAFTGDQSMGSNRLTNVGAPTADTDAARLQDIGPGFYGINVKQSDDAAAFTGIGTVAFNTDDFYVTQNDPNTDEVIVNFRGAAGGVTDHGALAGLGDDDHTQYILADGTRAFTGDQSMGSNRLTNVGAPTADTDAARLQDIGPGFYGINVKQTDDAASFTGIGTVGFNTSDFYITQNDPNTDEAIVNIRGVGEVNTASNLTGDEGLFAQKSGADLQFKSLTAGNNVTLSSDSNAVTVNADVGLADIPPAFYGINVKQSDDAASFIGIGTVAFNTDDFYITQNAPNTDEVIVNFRGAAGGGVTDHGALTGLGDDDHTQYTLADGTRAFTGDQSMGGNQLTNVGAPIADTDAARLQDIPPGFYGINVKQSDDVASFSGVNTVAFNTDSFYVTQNDPNTDEVVVNLRAGAIDHGTLTGLGDDDHTQYILADGTRAFTGDQSMGGNQLTNVGAPTADTDAARLQDIGPGFYGINVKQSDDAASFKGINTVAFSTDAFYITQNDPNTDEVIVNFRGVDTTPIGTVTGTFTSSVEWVLNHNLGNKPVLWSTFNGIDESIIPDKVDVSDENTAYFYFSTAVDGQAILSTGSPAAVSNAYVSIYMDDSTVYDSDNSAQVPIGTHTDNTSTFTTVESSGHFTVVADGTDTKITNSSGVTLTVKATLDVSTASAANHTANLEIQKNSASVTQRRMQASSFNIPQLNNMSLTGIFTLAPGDFLEPVLWSNNTTNQLVNFCTFSVVQVG
jgi:uncharacterized protein (DUF2252 family)